MEAANAEREQRRKQQEEQDALAMREAADRARLRWELQEAAWAWDNYCEDRMEALGVSERAARLLHMGQRVEDAMDFEKDLNLHEEDYNAKPPRS